MQRLVLVLFAIKMVECAKQHQAFHGGMYEANYYLCIKLSISTLVRVSKVGRHASCFFNSVCLQASLDNTAILLPITSAALHVLLL